MNITSILTCPSCGWEIKEHPDFDGISYKCSNKLCIYRNGINIYSLLEKVEELECDLEYERETHVSGEYFDEMEHELNMKIEELQCSLSVEFDEHQRDSNKLSAIIDERDEEIYDLKNRIKELENELNKVSEH